MGTIKECTVSFEDEKGVRHAVQVEAESLYEALGRALPRLRELGWTEDIENAHRFRVEARGATITHEVDCRQLEQWTRRACRGPAEFLLKSRVREMLGWKK